MSAAIVHASAVLIRSRGVLIRGPSGAGKSSLLLSLLHADPADAHLVADDRAVVTRRAEGLSMAPSEELAGLIEVRGQGIFKRPHTAPAPVDLVVDIRSAADCARLPDASERTVDILGVRVRRVFIASQAANGPARVAFALAELDDPSLIAS